VVRTADSAGQLPDRRRAELLLRSCLGNAPDHISGADISKLGTNGGRKRRACDFFRSTHVVFLKILSEKCQRFIARLSYSTSTRPRGFHFLSYPAVALVGEEHNIAPDKVVQIAHGVRTIEVVRLLTPHLDAEAEVKKIEQRELTIPTAS